jgi:hypothetical protein
VEVVSAKGPAKLSSKWQGIFIAMTVVGFAAFAYGAFGSGKERIGWISYLHNFYFFTGLSAAGVVLAAIMQAARSHWGRSVKRFAEAAGAFLPVALLLILPLYLGSEHLYEWVTDHPPEGSNKAVWLTKNFWFLRCLVAMLALNLFAWKFRSYSMRPDLGLAAEKNGDLWQKPANWKGTDSEVEHCYAKQSKHAVIYCIVYPFAISLICYDMIMSLDYRWISTMFGGWNFTTFMLLGWGVLYFLSHQMGNRFGVSHYIHKLVYHDLGKLTFGFTIVWGYLFFAQYMVIWYGNLPHETGYLLTRFYDEHWRPLSLIVLACCFLLPFILGLSKQIKMSIKTFWPIMGLSFIGIWLEKFILISPSVWYYDRHHNHYTEGISTLLVLDLLTFFGFLGLFALIYSRALYSKPIMVISDPRLDQGINRGH